MNTPTMPSPHTAAQQRDFKYISVITGFFATILVLATIASAKVFSIGPFALPGGTIIFPILFIFNDFLTEVYGYARSRQIIWTGLGCQAFAGLTLYVITALPPASFWHGQEAFAQILGFVPRVAVAGLCAYFSGELLNSFVLSKMKFFAAGARGLRQGWRFVASTMVGEAADSIVFMTIAFLGAIPFKNLVMTIITLYVVKVLYEIVALPASVPFSNWMKRVEGVDHIDTPETTNYNPFILSGR